MMKVTIILLALSLLFLMAYLHYIYRNPSPECAYDVKDYPVLNDLRNHWKDIATEAKSISRKNSSKRPQSVWVHDNEGITDFMNKHITDNTEWILAWDHGSKWWNYPLVFNDVVVPGETRKLCPKTVSLLERIKGIKIAGFSRLDKGGNIHPHTDYHGKKKALAYHLGLVGVDSELTACGGKVFNQDPGVHFIFDSEMEHSANNGGNQDRILLYILFSKEDIGAA